MKTSWLSRRLFICFPRYERSFLGPGLCVRCLPSRILRSAAECFSFGERPLDKTFSLYLQLLAKMRCKAPDLSKFLFLDSSGCEFITQDLAWREKEPPSPWTSTSMAMHMAEFKAHRLRWDSIKASLDVEESSDFQAGRGGLCKRKAQQGKRSRAHPVHSGESSFGPPTCS